MAISCRNRWARCPVYTRPGPHRTPNSPKALRAPQQGQSTRTASISPGPDLCSPGTGRRRFAAAQRWFERAVRAGGRVPEARAAGPVAGAALPRSALRRLKLTSRMTMLLEDITSNGRPPVKQLYDRLRRNKLVRPPMDGNAFPRAAVCVIPPRHGEATVLREPGKEPEEGALLLLVA